MKLRGLLVPAASLGPNVAYILIFAGLIFQLTGLVTLGIMFFGIAVLFSILTLPVEIGASRKALAMLDSTGIITSPDENARGAVDADGGGADLRRGGDHLGPDAALLPHAVATEQLTGP